ncbi:transcriptional protein SWT1-like [Ceratina calcarata]|uniref:Transcriptional protein SWT1-like n=1 Tax=Ceratina calcarata TaxID=156304 RepID=A0AAJ7S196_9HYME|nr:transcriptional protein SWT1-like [Ceratina calcarata]XP_026669492.1 transcriptional protein SWT1-like [Ceratina calcarata]
MIRNNLPNGWIALNSKRRPGQVYYYNAKTHQSSWEVPTTDEDSAEQITRKKIDSKKRKNLTQSSEDEIQSIISENDISRTEISTRKKLVARRTLKKMEEKVTEERETPQMKAIREKMLKKKSKAVQQIQAVSPKDVKKTLPQTPEKSSSSELNVVTNSNSKLVNTPQMEVLLEKIAGRKNTSKAIKVKQEKDSTIVCKGKERRTRLRRQSMLDQTDVPIISSSSGNDITREVKSPKVTPKRSLLQHRDSIEMNAATVKQSRLSCRKNLGKERMEKLRDSLEKQSDDTSIQSSLSGNKSSTFYKQTRLAKVRLTRLEEKALKNKLSSKGRMCANKQGERANPFKDTVTITDDEEPTTARDNSMRQSHNDSAYEEMDWEPLEVEKITHEVQAVRTQLCTENSTKTLCNIGSNTLKYPLLPEQHAKEHLYIVVDTNVFLSNIDAIEIAKETSFVTYDKPIIVIPWTVIRELDYIKDDNSKTKPATLCASARKAIKYINTLFSSNQSRIMSQTPEDVARNKRKFYTSCPDDEILQTCLQLRDLGKFVVLLSYDINLCNKAMIYNISTLGKNDQLVKIGRIASTSGNVPASNSKSADKNQFTINSKSIVDFELSLADDIYEDIKSIIRDFLTVIVSKEMHSLYGECWEKYVLIKPPWTTITVLQCAIKHWIAIVSESFTKKADVVMKELLQIFKDTSDGKRLEERGNILDKCSALVQMLDVSKHSDLMLRASKKIEEVKQKLDDYMGQVNGKKLHSIIGVENDVEEQERRAQKAFQFFEAAYVYARDMCGLASKSMGIVWNFHHNIPNPVPPLNYLEQIQSLLTINVNKLATHLIAILEQAKKSYIDKEALFNLHDTLINFLPEEEAIKFTNINLTPLDVYYCIKRKEDVLIRGLHQLQELDSQFSNLANYRYA